MLAHGAGAAMDSRFMNIVAEAIGGAEVRVVRFEFPYMAARRTSGKRGAPDREPVLIDAWRSVALTFEVERRAAFIVDGGSHSELDSGRTIGASTHRRPGDWSAHDGGGSL